MKEGWEGGQVVASQLKHWRDGVNEGSVKARAMAYLLP